MVVMGPSMAKESGLWTADTSKRITLTDESGEEIATRSNSEQKPRGLSAAPVQHDPRASRQQDGD